MSWPAPRNEDCEVFYKPRSGWFYRARSKGGWWCWWPAYTRSAALRNWYQRNNNQRRFGV